MSCDKSPIRAHSIQNARVLDLLAVDGHLISFRLKFSSMGPDLNFEPVGRNKASTFSGLCSEHDAQLFRPLDTKPFDRNDPEQLFLLAYRSVTRELHAVMEGAARMQLAYSSRVERGLDPADEISPAGALATSHLMNAFITYQYREKYFDEPLFAANYGAIEHDVLVLENQSPCIAVCSLFSLDEIEKEDDIVRVVLNVMPVDAKRTLAIFSYTRDDRAKARAALDRVFSSSGAYQKYELSRLILSHMENWLLSPAHFATWTAEKTAVIRDAFTATALKGEVREHPDLMLF
jgi:hypothetical protein